MLRKSSASRSAWSLQVTRVDKVTTSRSSAHKHLIVCQIELAGEVLKGSHLNSLFFPFLRDLVKGCLLGENPSPALISTAAWNHLIQKQSPWELFLGCSPCPLGDTVLLQDEGRTQHLYDRHMLGRRPALHSTGTSWTLNSPVLTSPSIIARPFPKE